MVVVVVVPSGAKFFRTSASSALRRSVVIQLARLDKCILLQQHGSTNFIGAWCELFVATVYPSPVCVDVHAELLTVGSVFVTVLGPTVYLNPPAPTFYRVPINPALRVHKTK